MLLTLLLQVSLSAPSNPVPPQSVQPFASFPSRTTTPVILRGAPYDVNVRLTEPASPPFPLSAIVTIAVAAIAAATSFWGVHVTKRIARESKETDYKHDFYKKIIERRLRAFEEAQELIAMLCARNNDGVENPGYLYCSTGERFAQAVDTMGKQFISQMTWMSDSYIRQYTAFYKLNLDIREDITITTKDVGTPRIHELSLKQATALQHNAIDNGLMELTSALHTELKGIPKVEEFIDKLTGEHPIQSGN